MDKPISFIVLFILIAVCFLPASVYSADTNIYLFPETYIHPTDRTDVTYIINYTGLYLSNDGFDFSNQKLYLNNSVFDHVPDVGSIDVYIDDYRPQNNTVEYRINTSGGVGSVSHEVGGLNNSERYSVHVDNSFWGAFDTNSTGVLSFSYSSWSNHTFLITKSSNVVPAQNIYNSAGDTVSFDWGNFSAGPGDTDVDGGTSKTYIKTTNNGSASGTATVSWNSGTHAYLNDTNDNRIPFNLSGSDNIEYYYGTGATPNDVGSWTSETDGNGTWAVTVPASSTRWVWFQIEKVPTGIPKGTYDMSFTWSDTS